MLVPAILGPLCIPTASIGQQNFSPSLLKIGGMWLRASLAVRVSEIKISLRQKMSAARRESPTTLFSYHPVNTKNAKFYERILLI